MRDWRAATVSIEAKLGKDTLHENAHSAGRGPCRQWAPANFDGLGALSAWAEKGEAPARLTLVEQKVAPSFPVTRARPLCEWPLWPRHGGGDVAKAGSFRRE